MSLGIYSRNTLCHPIIICDTCGQPITDCEKAIVTFPNPLCKGIVTANGVYHKGTCDPRISGRSKDLRRSWWMPLERYLSGLGYYK